VVTNKRREVAAEGSGARQWFTVGGPAPGRSASLAEDGPGGVHDIRAADPSFDPGAFTAWSDSVYRRAIAAWRGKNPEVLRPVMAQEVWNRYAEFLLAVSAVALGRKLMASAEPVSALAGAGADEHAHGVIIAFAVSIAASEASLIDERARRWQERWLFQRPASSRTHYSGSVAVCPVCGGSADPADSGSCPYCHADITTRTAGWLVTQVATTMHGATVLSRRRAAAAPGGGTALQPPPAGAPLQPPRAG
jgi:hypothetical protein